MIPVPKNQILQPKLPDFSQFKCIGLGGVGGPVARGLALFLGGLQREANVFLIDGDSFEPSNATRMFFGACGNKAAVVREELLPRFEDSLVTLIALEEFITTDNVGKVVQEGDIVLLTVDNHATRKLLNDYCGKLRDVCLISGGNDGVGKDSGGTLRRGTYGNVQVYIRQDGKDYTPPLTHFHPEIAKPEDRLPTDQSCTELVSSVPQSLFANLMVASCILNTLWLYLCGVLHYSEMAFDIAEGQMRPIVEIKKECTR